MKYIFLFFLLLIKALPAFSALTLNATRVIYEGNKKEASISLQNKGNDNIPYLVQSWVNFWRESSPNKGTRAPFIVTPPIFKLSANSQNIIRIIYTDNNLATDRESLFQLHINAIPAVTKEQNNRMIITNQSIVKLIYRPQGLKSSEANIAYNKLTFNVNGKNVAIKNPTPYVVNMGILKINGQNIERPGVIMPFSDKTILSPSNKVNDITLQAINDFGGLTGERQIKF